MRFPIDLVYLDRRRRVKKVRSAVPPWRLSACLSAHSVIELAAGTIRRTQTIPGDTLEFSSVDLVNENADGSVDSDRIIAKGLQDLVTKTTFGNL
jgi:hypothetical protein